MAVDAVSSSTSTTTTTAAQSASASASLNYESFLQLLIAQIQNQDPTDPMDASEQIAQLATFSQVEQTIQTNSNLENLISQTALSQASSYIGKTITSSDGETTGVIASVAVGSDGLTAITEDGSKVTIEAGITLAATE
ncbi:flagellar hook assembly protein FlgD [Rhizobium sp. PAMB 3182]